MSFDSCDLFKWICGKKILSQSVNFNEASAPYMYIYMIYTWCSSRLPVWGLYAYMYVLSSEVGLLLLLVTQPFFISGITKVLCAWSLWRLSLFLLVGLLKFFLSKFVSNKIIQDTGTNCRLMPNFIYHFMLLQKWIGNTGSNIYLVLQILFKSDPVYIWSKNKLKSDQILCEYGHKHPWTLLHAITWEHLYYPVVQLQSSKVTGEATVAEWSPLSLGVWGVQRSNPSLGMGHFICGSSHALTP